MDNEVLFGNLCVQENLCTNDEIENAIKTQKKLGKIGVQKRLGEILIAKGVISVTQLEAIIKIQFKLFQSDEEAVLGQLAVNNEIITRKQLETAQNILKNRFKEDSSKQHNLINVLVELGFADQSKINSLNKLYNKAFGKERQLAFCAHCQQLVENIKGQCGICGKTLPPVSKRGDTMIFRLLPEPEAQNKSNIITERLKTISKSDESTLMTKVRASARMEVREPVKLKELPERFSGTRLITYAVLILVVGVVVGMFLRFRFDGGSNFPDEPKTDDNGTEYVEPAPNMLTVDDLLPLRDVDDNEKAKILRALGFTAVSDGRWLPNSYVQDSVHWQKRQGIDLARLQPFEFDGKRFNAIVNKIDSSTYMLEFADGKTKDYPAIEIIEQMQTYQQYREELNSRESYENSSEFYERLGDFCENNGWFVEARNNYVISYINDPENVDVRRKLKFILPGESSVDSKSKIFMPEIVEIPINPEIPAVKLDIPLRNDLGVNYEPGMLDWKKFSLPLTAADMVTEDAWNIDIERQRMNDGESLYLGYWLKTAMLKDWRKRAKIFRKTTLENDVFVATEEFQINNEILNSARILYQLSKNFYNKEVGKFTGNKSINLWQGFDKKFMLIVCSEDTNKLKYSWLSAQYELVFVDVQDFRRLEDLIFPLLRAYFDIFIQKSGLKAITEWVEEGMKSEFAYAFIQNEQIVFQQKMTEATVYENWRRVSAEEIENLHTLYVRNTRDISADLVNMCWGVVRMLKTSKLSESLYLQSNAEDMPTRILLFLNEYKKIGNEIHSNLGYECTNGQRKIREFIRLNKGNVEFLSPVVCDELMKSKNGLFTELDIMNNVEKYSALELWVMLGLSAYLDEIQFGTKIEKEKLKEDLLNIFADKPAFQKLINDY